MRSPMPNPLSTADDGSPAGSPAVSPARRFRPQLVPTVAVIAWLTGTELALGVEPMSAVLLTLSFIMAIITYGTGRASLLSGIVHLIMLAVWLFLIVVP